MRMVQLSLVGAVLIFGLLGCAGDDSKGGAAAPTPGPTAVELGGRGFSDLVALKYNKAVLTCELWTQHTTKLDLSGKPDSVATWDLKAGDVLPRTLNLSAEFSNHSVKAEIKLVSVGVVENVRLKNTDGAVYLVRNTPFVVINVRNEATTMLEDGPFTSSGMGSDFKVYEKAKDILFNEAVLLAPKTRGSARDYAHCFVDTEIKPEYQDQFQVE